MNLARLYRAVEPGGCRVQVLILADLQQIH